jgi:hypothetical protein
MINNKYGVEVQNLDFARAGYIYGMVNVWTEQMARDRARYPVRDTLSAGHLPPIL